MTDWIQIGALAAQGAVALLVYAQRAQTKLITDRIDNVAATVGEVRTDVREARDQLRTLNGRVGRVETWREDHSEACAERHERHQADLREVKEELRAVRQSHGA